MVQEIQSITIETHPKKENKTVAKQEPKSIVNKKEDDLIALDFYSDVKVNNNNTKKKELQVEYFDKSEIIFFYLGKIYQFIIPSIIFILEVYFHLFESMVEKEEEKIPILTIPLFLFLVCVVPIFNKLYEDDEINPIYAWVHITLIGFVL